MPSPLSWRKVREGLSALVASPFSRTARARLRHPRLYRMLGRTTPYSLHDYHTRIAASYARGRLERVLVVGCNTGQECKSFVDLQASQVHGLDVVENTGRGFTHARVSYLRSSAECIAVRDATYDLVYSYATMEHVPDISAAFRECARVTRPGGIIYSLAAPLWNSRYGHHKAGIFAAYPWIHLQMSEQEIIDLCERENIADPTGRNDIAKHVRYMMNPAYFNKTSAESYLDACRTLRDVKVITNELNLESSRVLDQRTYLPLQAKGYSRQELLALGHLFVGRKRS